MTASNLFLAGIASIVATILSLSGQTSAAATPVPNPNGSFTGVIDGHELNLPVRCLKIGQALDISSHLEVISTKASFDSIDPVMNIVSSDNGFQFVAFIDGQRYKFLETSNIMQVFPYEFADEVRASKIGKIHAKFAVDCAND